MKIMFICIYMASNELSKFRTIWYMGIPLYTTPCNCQRGRNELSKFRAIWYMGIPYIPHHVIVKEEDLYDPKLRNFGLFYLEKLNYQ